MVFAPPVGVLNRKETIDPIASGPKWAQVALEDPRMLALASGVALLTCRARARREGDGAAYGALATSVDVRRRGEWKLAFHQQTRVDDG